MNLDGVAPITQLKRDAAELIAKAEASGSPVVITQNGRATAVLIDARSYDEDQRAFAILKLALQGEAAIAEGRGISHAAHRARVANVLKAKVAKR